MRRFLIYCVAGWACCWVHSLLSHTMTTTMAITMATVITMAIGITATMATMAITATVID